MLSNVLPGLRELRAPLAGGYLWLVFAWMAWGDKLPSNSREKADDPIDRLYRLEPVISSIGLAVIASVAAYLLGSIVIDLQTVIGRRLASPVSRALTPPAAALEAFLKRWATRDAPAGAGRQYGFAMARTVRYANPKDRPPIPKRVKWWFLAIPERLLARALAEQQGLSLTEAGKNMLDRWVSDRAEELNKEFAAERREAVNYSDPETEMRELSDQGVDQETVDSYRDDIQDRALHARKLAEALNFTSQDVASAAREYIVSNRDLLKTRLIDESEPLHSELDRPDAEATFRMALWPPLAALIIYLALEKSWWWAFAMVVPVLLAFQWMSLRRQANAALVAAFVARDELGGKDAQAEVRKATVDKIRGELGWQRAVPPLMFTYPDKPAPPSPEQVVDAGRELPPHGRARQPQGGGARASDGPSGKVRNSGEP